MSKEKKNMRKQQFFVIYAVLLVLLYKSDLDLIWLLLFVSFFFHYLHHVFNHHTLSETLSWLYALSMPATNRTNSKFEIVISKNREKKITYLNYIECRQSENHRSQCCLMNVDTNTYIVYFLWVESHQRWPRMRGLKGQSKKSNIASIWFGNAISINFTCIKPVCNFNLQIFRFRWCSERGEGNTILINKQKNWCLINVIY